jgi:hypothetical protein
MTSTAPKQSLYQQLEAALSGPFVALKDDDPLVVEMARVSAARRGLRVYQGGATAKSAQQLPPYRPRRTLFGGTA